MIPGIPEHLIDTADKTVIGGDGIAIKGSPFWIRIKNRTTWTVTGYLRGPDHDKISNNVEDARDLVKGPLDPNKSSQKNSQPAWASMRFSSATRKPSSG